MATLLQKRLAENIVKNARAKTGKNKQEIVVSSGYSPISADRHASEIIESKGTQKELEKLGFTSDNAKRVVAEILLKESVEEKDRLKAAELVFKVQGDFAAEKHLNVNVNSEMLQKAIVDKMALFRLNTGSK